jgi:hypothetical protein
MRPANWSATVFQTKAASGAVSLTGRVIGAPAASRAANGRSAAVGSQLRMAFSAASMPTLRSAEVQMAGKIVAAAVARCRPVMRSWSFSVPASKNFSINVSSASATASISAVRAACASCSIAAGTGPSAAGPPSAAAVKAFMPMMSTMPVQASPSPIVR